MLNQKIKYCAFYLFIFLGHLVFQGCNTKENKGVEIVPGKIPEIVTEPITAVGQHEAICGGTVISEGDAPVNERGVCWGNYVVPNIWYDRVTWDSIGLGSYLSKLTFLTTNTKYYVCAYATNKYGTAYGSVRSFKTKKIQTIYGEGVTDIDNNYYKSLIIGNQEWMAENLKVTNLNDGSPIPEVKDNDEWGNLTVPAYCWMLNDEKKYKNLYGALYNFYTIQTLKLCPEGWHVPGKTEWEDLIDSMGGPLIAGGKLKETGIEHWASPNNLLASDEVEFKALPGGNRPVSGIFNGGSSVEYSNANFWTSTKAQDPFNWVVYIFFFEESIGFNTEYSSSGNSVRCVKD